MSFSPITLGNGVAGYNFLTRTRETQQALYEQSPEVARDIARFKDKIEGVTTAEALMGDRDMLRVALGAFGLGDDLDNRAFIQQVLESDLDDSTSLANRLSDKRYLAMAETFNFAGTGGAQIDIATPENDITAQLSSLKTSDDLLSDGPLLRAALKAYDLSSNVQDVFFLQRVLDSDLQDAESFANQLSDPKYAEFSAIFGFGEKLKSQDSALTQFANAFDGQFATLETAQDLVENSALFETAVKMFNLENEIYRPDFMQDVLNSDLNDPASVANQQGDPRYVALAQAFEFTEPFATRESKAEAFVDVVLSRETLPDEPSALFSDFRLLIAANNFFDAPVGGAQTRYMQRLLEADPSDPQSLVAGLKDQQYIPFVNAFQFDPVVEPPNYPTGFAAQITAIYAERQFEIEVGNSDNSMRVALALERELDTVIETGTTEDSRWFAVMASPALRSVFETAFRLPTSFGTLDIDQQLVEFKSRSEQFFDTTDVADFAQTDLLDTLRQTYLMQQAPQSGVGSSSAGLAASLLAGFQF